MKRHGSLSIDLLAIIGAMRTPLSRSAWMLGLSSAGVILGLACGLLLVMAKNGVFSHDIRYEIPPCFEVGSPFHHRYRENCHGKMRTPRGEVQVSTNEDGLRELARQETLREPSRVLVVGDSFVEGWWMSREQGISAELSRLFPGTYFVNGGLRSTGPMLQAESLGPRLEAYRPKGILWFLNDTDGADDRLACAVLENPDASPGARRFGIDEFLLDGWRAQLVSLLGDSAPSRWLRRVFYQRRWKALVHGEGGKRCGACKGVEEFKAAADRAGVPVLAVFTNTDTGLLTGHYEGEEQSREEIMACLARHGVSTVTANTESMSSELRERYLWPADFHLNPEGVQWFAGQIGSDLSAWLAALAALAAKKPAAKP
jgi:hypothetical protein